jgi:diguanylate cyclase (GGDEF)-like protein
MTLVIACGGRHDAKYFRPEVLRMARFNPAVTTQRTEQLVEEVCASDTLPSVPVVAANVLSMSKDPDVDFAELGRMISTDPALVAKLLRMANSAVFGSRAKLGSIRAALVRMGVKVTRMTVLSFSLEAEISRKVPASFDIDRFWRHALTAATAARTIAERVSLAHRDDAFSAGILQDIGIVAFQCAMPEKYAEVFELRKTRPELELYELEMEVIGTTHVQVGSHLLRKWGLPPEVCDPVLYHHCPEAGDDVIDDSILEVARILNLSLDIAGLFNYNADQSAHEALMSEGMKRFGLKPEIMEQVMEKVETGVRETCDLFKLDPRAIPSYADMRVQAAQELARLSLELGQEQQEAKAEAQEAKAEADELRKLASHDDLTGLLNRREFMKRFVNELVRCRRHQHALAVVIFDIDHFKAVNDTFGHTIGDDVLRAMGAHLNEDVRRSDVVARYGGEEFILLLPETDYDGAVLAAEKLRMSIEMDSEHWCEELAGITVSVGVAYASHDTARFDAKVIINEADKCLYQAKGEGRNCVRSAIV